MNFRIGALGFSTGPSDCGWGISWHHPKDVTWRWGLSLDYFWRSQGYNGPVLPLSRRQWQWKYLIPRPWSHIMYRDFGGKLRFNQHGSFGFNWLGFSLMHCWQPKWDRTFDVDKARREDREDTERQDMRRAIHERQSARLQ